MERLHGTVVRSRFRASGSAHRAISCDASSLVALRALGARLFGSRAAGGLKRAGIPVHLVEESVGTVVPGCARGSPLLRGHRTKCLLRRMLDETEFSLDYGVRALSKVYENQPCVFAPVAWI